MWSKLLETTLAVCLLYNTIIAHFNKCKWNKYKTDKFEVITRSRSGQLLCYVKSCCSIESDWIPPDALCSVKNFSGFLMILSFIAQWLRLGSLTQLLYIQYLWHLYLFRGWLVWTLSLTLNTSDVRGHVNMALLTPGLAISNKADCMSVTWKNEL